MFRSAKLNDQKANLLKPNVFSRSRQELNDDPSIQKYFSEKLNNVRNEDYYVDCLTEFCCLS